MHNFTISATAPIDPPAWAVKQRRLIDLMNRGALTFIKKYTRDDGSLIWRKHWPGMDGADDGYEGFLTFGLLYILGGADHLLELGRKQWDAVTRQFTEYGQVHRGFAAYYDWMHHGESYPYLYYLAMADPECVVSRERAVKFAAMYNGDDPEAPNWDDQLKMIRSPINGSRGPRSQMSAEDWVTHRPILANYLCPYEDVPGVDSDDPRVIVDWNDDEMFERVLSLMNQRMVPGDVPVNLNATSLMTHAFAHTGDSRYRQWVLDYVQAWMDRTEQNGGIIPDNVGPSGIIGERMGGKWWGGYYGWRWPHGAWLILETTLIAGCNAMLLTGDAAWLDLFRSQADLIWSLRRNNAGQIEVPARHGDGGWFNFRPIGDSGCFKHYLHAYYMTGSEQDLARLNERFADRSFEHDLRSFGKAGEYPPDNWLAYMEGRNPGFPDGVADDTDQGIRRRFELSEQEDPDVETWDVHHWQERNPVIPQGLIQMAMGTPGPIYQGGMLHASVRYFDANRRRPGLPDDLAALVSQVNFDGIAVTLVNTGASQARQVIVQAGAFAEHRFTSVKYESSSDTQAETELDSRYVNVVLPPKSHAHLHLHLQRFAHMPTYDNPPYDDAAIES